MPEYELDPGFEQRLERVLRTFADEGVDRFDAMETTQFAIHGARSAAPPAQRSFNPWLRPLLAAALLTLVLVAVGVAGGWIRLPTNDLPVNPTFEPFSPPPLTTFDPSVPPASGIPPSALPTTPLGTGGPGPTSAPDTFPPSITPTPDASPVGPTIEPSIEPSPGFSVEPSVEPSPEPTPDTTVEPTLPPPADVVAVGVGNLQTCALRGDGHVLCFGPNEMGELGDGTTTDRYSADVPVVGLDDAIQVDGGIRFTCAVRDTGAVVCWGENGSGQLGNGTVQNSPVPVGVIGIDNAVTVVAGGSHACALLRDGRVMCWGMASKLGAGHPGNSSDAIASPVPVAGIDDAVELAAGWNHTCARRAAGTVSCWGGNGDGATGYGQLGNGTFDHASTPVDVADIADATALAAGGWTTCALRSAGTAWCWGYGERGGLGDGNSANSATPVQVSGISDARRIAVGGWHACAVIQNGRAMCWGANSWGSSSGQLGDGTGIDRATPVEVTGVPRLRDIEAAWIHTVGITSDDRLWLWGWSAGDGGRNPGEIFVSGAPFE